MVLEPQQDKHREKIREDARHPQGKRVVLHLSPAAQEETASPLAANPGWPQVIDQYERSSAPATYWTSPR